MVPDMLCSGSTGSLDPRPAQDAFRLPATEGSVGEARRRVRAALFGWGADPRHDDLSDDLALVVSELFTNAVRHTASAWVDVSLWADRGLLYIEVTDQGRTADDIVVRTADAGDECGRGLTLVEHLAVGWGAGRSRHGAGHTVWAALRGRCPGTAGAVRPVVGRQGS